jgi:hypothetical protein
MTWNRFSWCFSTKWSNAGIRKGSASRGKCETSSINRPKWITMALSRAAKECFSVFETGSSARELSGVSSKHLAGRLSRNSRDLRALFRDFYTFADVWPILSKDSDCTNDSYTDEDEWRQDLRVQQATQVQGVTKEVVYTIPCFVQIRRRAGIAASVRLRIATKKI